MSLHYLPANRFKTRRLIACLVILCATILALAELGRFTQRSIAMAGEATADTFVVEQGDVKLTATVDKMSVQIAESFSLTIKVNAPQGTRIKLPPKVKRLGEFDVVSISDVFDIPDGRQRLWKRVLRLDSIESGDLVIPGIEIQAALADSSDYQPITSPAIPIQVVSVLEGREDPTQFRDIKNVVDVSLPAEPSFAWVWWAVCGISVLAIGTFALIVSRRRRELSPDKRALAELDELANSDLLAAGSFDVFYTRLVDILRRYIEQRFSIAASRQTTREFLENIRDDSRLVGDLSSQLDAILSVADRVKFGKFSPGDSHMQTALDHANQFVRQSAGTSVSPAKQEAA